MPPLEDHQILVHKDRQTLFFGGQTSQDYQADLNSFKTGEVTFDDKFIREQTRSQQDFYGDYERKWNRQPEGFLVAPPDSIEAPEIEIQNIKLSYKDRKERKANINASYSMWSARMASFSTHSVHQVNDEKLHSVYGLHLLNTLTEDERKKKIAKLEKKGQEAQFQDSYKTGDYTLEMMKSTTRLATKEKIKRDLVDEMLVGQKPDPLFVKYREHFLAIAPALLVAHDNDLARNVQVTDASKDAFKAFIKRAIEHPIETLKEAVSDSLYSFRQIPDKLLDKEAMPQKFDEVKELRDRYKAITDLFEGGYNDEMGKAFKELANNQEEAPRDNIIFAKGLYQRIDADMRFCLQENKMKFDENDLLVDRRDVKNAHIKVDGNQSASLLRAVKKNATKQKRADVERYWDNKCRKILVDDDNKDIKGGEDFADNYHIVSALASVSKEKRGSVKGKENKGLFDDLKDRGDQLALAVAEIDKELQKSTDIFTRKAEEFKVRPQAKMQLERFIQKRKRQQIELIDRARGVINAMNYLAESETLNANGRQVLDDVREVKSKVTHVTHDKEGKTVSVNEYEKVDFLREEMTGKHRSVAELSNSPLSYKAAKNKLLDKFKDKVDNRLRNLFDLDTCEFRYNMLLLQNEDLFNLDYNQVCDKIENADILLTSVETLRSAILENNKATDRLSRTLEEKVISKMNEKEIASCVREYNRLKERIYAANKLKKMKPPVSNLTMEILLKNHKTVAEVEKFKNNELITNFKFKVISDELEEFRCNAIVNHIEAGDSPSLLCSEAEKSKMKKMSPQEQADYFKTKSEAAERLKGKHFGEFYDATDKSQVLMNITNERSDYAENIDIVEQNVENQEEYTKEERKERKNKKATVVLEKLTEDEQTEEQAEERKRKNRDFVARNDYILQYGEDFVTSMEYKQRRMPEFDGSCAGKMANEFQRFMVAENLADFKLDAADIERVFDQVEQTEEQKKLVDAYKTAYSNLASKGYMDKIIKKMVPEKALDGADIDNISLPVSIQDQHLRWLLIQFKAVKKAQDIKDLKRYWELRNEYYKKVYGQGMDVLVFTKANALLTELTDILDKKEKEAKVKKNVDGISNYQSGVNAQQQAKTFNLKDGDKDGTYKFDQHQKGSYGCWAASHTYVVNTYMKVNKIQGDKFTQDKFKTEDNYIPNEIAKKYLEDQNDQNPESMSFNQEANNIQNFLAKDKTGNPYITADTVINALPKTAEHHLVFTNFYLNVMDEKKEEVKTKLSDYIMDKIQGELDRTKVPISLLRSGHYLSVVGVDRARKELITMDSLKKGTKLEEPTIVPVTDLIEMDKFELIYPENLEDENLKYLTDKFGLKKDLYDENGRMKMDEEIQKAEKDSLEKPQNMLHISGVEFERKTRDFDFEENFVAEQIYMPKDLKLKKEETK